MSRDDVPYVVLIGAIVGVIAGVVAWLLPTIGLTATPLKVGIATALAGAGVLSACIAIHAPRSRRRAAHVSR